MTLAPYIHAMGRGPSRARSLTREEAREAMAIILGGEAAPEAVGALLMLMRYRGETAEEIAGFTDAARQRLSEWHTIGPVLDWPSYAAGRSRGQPYFLLAAKLVAEAGFPVLLHGWNSHQNPVADIRGALSKVGIRQVRDPASARQALRHHRIAYAPLEAVEPEILRLLRLRDVLGLRSAVNTMCRMLNPGHAEAAVQGVFHPSYRDLQQDTAALLGLAHMIVLKGGGGEFERNPAKDVGLFGLRNGAPYRAVAPASLSVHRKLAEATSGTIHLARLWAGEASDQFAEEIITGTCGAALLALNAAPTIEACDQMARDLWSARCRSAAA
ncbi:MAG: glycosyl transferase family protein [Pseudomonadota bacterium]